MRALITGANGFVGSTLARRLCAAGAPPRCLVMPGDDASPLDGLPVELVPADVTRPEGLAKAVEGCDAVVHLAGIRRAPGREAFFRVNAEGTRTMCEAILQAGGRARLVLAGSLAAVGPRRDAPTEEAPFAPRDWYGESKAEAERIAYAYAGRLPVTVARPSRILGPGDRENLLFFKIVQKGLKVSLLGEPRPLFSFIDVEDVVDALLVLAEKHEAVGHSFFLSHETATMEELQELVARALGTRTFTVPIPRAVFRAVVAGADLVSRATGKHLPVNRKMAQQLLVPGWTCSTVKARERLGFSAKTPMAESIERAARWYREKGWL
ncbi:MAG: NAD-dependent epimerase/dehydratase family protein [Deltaproteobacteria bacterium]|nr:NAD-dependent epimerase/dehydratase family protein [Deltaproteobacteria bacterium]